ncbi:MAG: helix-turn-helix domain-containing protein [Desulfopila sp.]
MNSIFCDIGSFVSSPCCKILESIIEFAFITCKGPDICLEHLPGDLLQGIDRPQSALSGAEQEEAEKIRALLQQYPDSRPKAARAMGISRTTLWRKMKQYGIEVSNNGT